MITDWKGNEIKPGMDIVLILTCYKEYFRELGSEPMSDVPCWEVSVPYKVSIENGIIGYWTNGTLGNGYTYNGFHPLPNPFLSSEVIIGIKGISDQNPNICIQ